MECQRCTLAIDVCLNTLLSGEITWVVCFDSHFVENISPAMMFTLVATQLILLVFD